MIMEEEEDGVTVNEQQETLRTKGEVDRRLLGHFLVTS